MIRALVLVGILGGCAGLGVGDAFDPVPIGEASIDAGTAPLAVEIGSGATSFVALRDGDAVDIIAGPQGGFHIWTSVRIQGPGVREAHVALSLRFANGGALAGPGLSIDLPFLPAEGASEHVGLTNFVTDPEAVRGAEVVMRAEVATGGRTGSAEHTVVPR